MDRLAKRIVLFLLAACMPLCANSQVPQRSLEFTALPPAQYAAGYLQHVLVDSSRPSLSGQALGRRIHMIFWFPAVKGTGKPMTLGRYADLLAEHEPEEGGWPSARAQMSVGQDGGGLPERGQAVLRALPALGFEDAKPAEGKFPLVVLAQGLYYESPWHQSYLAEALAERGYTVVSAPLLGARAPLAQISAADVEAQARDLEMLLMAATSLKATDSSRIAFVGFDLGGIAALKAHARNCCSKAYVAIDSGIAAPFLTDPTLGKDIGDARGHLLLVTRPTEELQARKLPEDFALLNSARGADRYVLRVPGMRHADFSNIGVIESLEPGLWGQASPQANAGWNATANAILKFLPMAFGARSDNPPWQRIGSREDVIAFDALALEWLAHPDTAPTIPPGKPCAWQFSTPPGAPQVARLEEELKWRRGSPAFAAGLAALRQCVAPAAR